MTFFNFKWKKQYNLNTVSTLPKAKFDVIVLGVAHSNFMNLDFEMLKNKNAVIYDIKSVLGNIADARL